MDDLEFDDDFSGRRAELSPMKEITDNLNFTKIKTSQFCKRHGQENEKTSYRLRNYLQRHRVLSKISRGLLKFNKMPTNLPKK